jgi:hypothetical protein
MRTPHLHALAGAGALVLAAAVAPGRAHAQLAALDVRVGAAPVLGRYRREFDAAPTVGVGVTVGVTSALGVRADARWAPLRFVADGDIGTYTLGLEAQTVVVRGRLPLHLGAALGGGASRISFDRAQRWHPTVTGGARVSVDVVRRFDVFLDATAVATLLGDRAPQLARPTDAGGTLVQLPVTAGVRIRF